MAFLLEGNFIMTQGKDEAVEEKAGFNIETIIKLSPFILIFPQIAGGALGGVCGALGWSFNEFIFKKDIATPLKYGAALFSLIAAGGLYILFAAVLVAIFPDLAG